MKNLRCLLVVYLLCLSAVASFAQDYHYVKPHYTRDGEFVDGHYATNPNGTPWDNWSTRGNYNPVTGQPGYVTPSTGYYDRYGIWHPHSH